MKNGLEWKISSRNQKFKNTFLQFAVYSDFWEFEYASIISIFDWITFKAENYFVSTKKSIERIKNFWIGIDSHGNQEDSFFTFFVWLFKRNSKVNIQFVWACQLIIF